MEPFLVILLGLEYPLHGYLHTFFAAFFFGLILGLVMFSLEKFLNPLYRVFLLVPRDGLNLRSFMLTGAFGTVLHVLLDSPLYSDIQPFFPLTTNPMYNPALALDVYRLCFWAGIFGIIFFVGMVVFAIHRKFSTQK